MYCIHVTVEVFTVALTHIKVPHQESPWRAETSENQDGAKARSPNSRDFGR